MPKSNHEPYISVTKGMRGWFAVQYWWNPEGFTEPWTSSPISFSTKAEAEADAITWAEAEELECHL